MVKDYKVNYHLIQLVRSEISFLSSSSKYATKSVMDLTSKKWNQIAAILCIDGE